MPLSYDAMYRALVTSVADPTNSGKIRVQCPQISGVAEIRSAEPVNPADRIPAVGSTVWIAFNGGDLTKPVYFTNSSIAQINPNGSAQLISLATTGSPDPSRVLALSGNDGQSTGSSTAPIVLVIDDNATSSTDLGVSGSVIKTDIFGGSEIWHTPTFTSAWASTNTLVGVGGYRGMQYRKDAEDNVWVLGAAVASNTGGTIFNLPGSYTNSTERHLLPAWVYDGSTTPKAVMAQVTEAGSVNISNALTGFVTASGYEVFINGKFPLGNLS